MADYLDKLAKTALETIESGYYTFEGPSVSNSSFVKAVESQEGLGIITEVKPSSPSGGNLIGEQSATDIVDLYVDAGVAGLSILTEPVHFGGNLENLSYAAQKGLPVLFKDFVLDAQQLKVAQSTGASAVLLILALFERGYSKLSLDEMIQASRDHGLEVLLEVYDRDEYERALNTNAHIIGINNRDLKTLEVDLNTTKTILEQCKKGRMVWSLSGVYTEKDLEFLSQCGADACLIGTSLMKSDRPQELLKQLLASAKTLKRKVTS